MDWNNVPDDSRLGDGSVDDNVIEQLDALPDKLRLGFYIALAGLAILATDYCWPLSFPTSFKMASAIFLNYFWWLGYLPGRYHRGIQFTLPQTLFFWGSVCGVCSVFIFVRRAVWRFEDRRPASIIQLTLERPTHADGTGTKRGL
jgi:hypothetical protein